MTDLSISAAWEQSKAILAHDGRLFVSVSLALVALPAAVTGLVSPDGLGDSSSPVGSDLIVLVASVIALAGQLALIRLALGPSITVGGAIAHGLRRMPIYLLSAIMIVVALVLLAVPFGGVLVALGVPLERTAVPPSPGAVIVMLLYLAVIIFVGVRMMLAAPAASAEPIGPIAILRRSWSLTSAHFWRLLGFLLIFFVGAIIVLLAVGSAAGVVVGILIGPITPLSASALILALIQAVVNAAMTILFAVMLARIYAQLAGRGDAQTSVPNSGT